MRPCDASGYDSLPTSRRSCAGKRCRPRHVRFHAHGGRFRAILRHTFATPRPRDGGRPCRSAHGNAVGRLGTRARPVLSASGRLRDLRVDRHRRRRLLRGLCVRPWRRLAFDGRVSRRKRRHASCHRRRTDFAFGRRASPAARVGNRAGRHFASRPHALKANARRSASLRSFGRLHGGVSLRSGNACHPHAARNAAHPRLVLRCRASIASCKQNA